jgi:hypothetical protein
MGIKLVYDFQLHVTAYTVDTLGARLVGTVVCPWNPEESCTWVARLRSDTDDPTIGKMSISDSDLGLVGSDGAVWKVLNDSIYTESGQLQDLAEAVWPVVQYAILPTLVEC